VASAIDAIGDVLVESNCRGRFWSGAGAGVSAAAGIVAVKRASTVAWVLTGLQHR
jgi:hypothetical protein